MPLLGMTIAAFIFNTSEFMPIGLLTNIAQTFSITQTQAGAMITIYSWAVMLLSLPLMILASKYNLKKVLLTTLFLFGLGQAISAISMNFAILILGRLIVACAHAVFWSIASVIAVRLVNEDKREFAMSMIVTGTSVAMIAGLPLGRMIGLWMGWRITFLIVGIISILLLLFQTHYLPSLETTSAFTLYQLPTLLRNKQLITIYGISLLFASAYYTAYSYIAKGKFIQYNNYICTFFIGCCQNRQKYIVLKFQQEQKEIHLSFTILSYTCFILIKTKCSIHHHTLVDVYYMGN